VIIGSHSVTLFIITGNKLQGIQLISSHINHEECAPIGLKYLKEITFHHACNEKSRRVDSIISLEFEYGLIGFTEELSHKG